MNFFERLIQSFKLKFLIEIAMIETHSKFGLTFNMTYYHCFHTADWTIASDWKYKSLLSLLFCYPLLLSFTKKHRKSQKVKKILKKYDYFTSRINLRMKFWRRTLTLSHKHPISLERGCKLVEQIALKSMLRHFWTVTLILMSYMWYTVALQQLSGIQILN